jgi:hypothetical protein
MTTSRLAPRYSAPLVVIGVLGSRASRRPSGIAAMRPSKLQRGIKGVLAEWESDETSQRTYKRQRYRAQQGKWRGGPPPYGAKPDGKGWFEPDLETYPYLLWILEWRAECQSFRQRRSSKL